jgi:hypothetical protein
MEILAAVLMLGTGLLFVVLGLHAARKRKP